MKDLHIVIEKIKNDHICLGCLNGKRRMFYNKNALKSFKLLSKVHFPANLVIEMCYECNAILKKVCSFQQQIKRSYQTLVQYATEEHFMDSKNNFEERVQRLTVTDVRQFEYLGYNYDRVECTEVQVPLKTFEMKQNSKATIEIKAATKIPKNVNYDAQEIDDESTSDDLSTDDLESDDESILDDNDSLINDDLDEEKSTYESFGFGKVEKDFNGDIEFEKVLVSEDVVVCEEKSNKVDEAVRSKMKTTLNTFQPNQVETISATLEEIIQIRTLDASNPAFQNAKYKCLKCLSVWNDASSLLYHDVAKHEVTRYASCDICQIQVPSKTAFEKHILTHTFYLKCLKCEFKTTLSHLMKLHLVEHTESKGDGNAKGRRRIRKTQSDFKCQHCGKIFDKSWRLSSHIKQTHSTDQYTCQYCGISIKYSANLRRHIRQHKDKEENNIYECRLCNFTTPSHQYYQRHLKYGARHNDRSEMYQCDYCNRTFRSKQGIIEHMERNHFECFPYKKCRICAKPFISKNRLEVHLQMAHYSSNEILCDICGKTWKSQSKLHSHTQAHKLYGTRHVSCAHRNINDASKRKHTCGLCGKVFSYSGNMVRHLRTTHAKKTVPCEHCGKLFKSTHEKGTHIIHVHMKVPWPKRARNRNRASDNSEFYRYIYTHGHKSQKGVARAKEVEIPQPLLEVDEGEW